MKDKRTYTNKKEHGEDMSHENESTITNEDRGPNDLDFLIKELREHNLTQAKEIDRLNEYVQILEMEKKN